MNFEFQFPSPLASSAVVFARSAVDEISKSVIDFISDKYYASMESKWSHGKRFF